MLDNEAVRYAYEAACVLACQVLYSVFDLRVIVNQHSDWFYRQPRCCGLSRLHVWSGIRRGALVEYKPDPPDRWSHFLEELHPLPRGRRFDIGEPRHIAARSRQAGYKATGDRVCNDGEDDRNRVRLCH